MSYKILILCALVLAFLFLIYRGDRAIKAKRKLDEQMTDIYGEMSEVFNEVVYQGGFPPMPKPAYLTLGITDSALILYDKEGNNGKIEYEKIKKVERFITQRKRKYKFGLMAYGPIALILNKPAYCHFFTAEYTDVNGEKNIMTAILKTRDMAEQLYQSVKPHVPPRSKKSKKKKK